MSEFGHDAYAVGIGKTVALVDNWGAGPFVIFASGKSWRFEDSDRFGPYLIRNNGAIRDNPWPPERSPFWQAHRAWIRQGRRVSDDGITCIYEPLRPTKYWVDARRVIHVVEEGDPDGGEICVEPPESGSKEPAR